jgi:hypothetical protein
MAEETEILNFFDIRIEHFPDRSARWLFQDKENVRGLVEIVAGELVELIDFSQLSQINRSFIPDNLREQESDLVFSVPLQSESETDELLIYILIEHQATVDSTMGFRVLFYMTQNDSDLGFPTPGMGIGQCPQKSVAFSFDSPDSVLHRRTAMAHPADPQCNNGHPRYVFAVCPDV